MSMRLLQASGIVLFSLLLFTWRISGQEVTSFDSRFYLFALEMWRHGVSWFPTTYHQPYPDYPPLSIWLIQLAASLMGQLNKLAALLPTACFAALTLAVTWLIGETQQRRLGTYAVCFLFMTAGFIKEARAISLDMAVTCVTVATFYILILAEKHKCPRWVAWVYPLLILSFANRGPIGLIIPTSVMCVFYLASRQIKRLFVTGLLALLVLIVCIALLLALAHHVGGETFIQQVVTMQFAGRMITDYLPPYFYFSAGMSNDAIALPFAMLTIVGVIISYLFSKRTHDNKLFFIRLSGWVLIIMLGMSIPGDKKIRYILPVLPAAALLAAYPLLATRKDSYFYRLGMIYRFIILLVPGLLGACLLVMCHRIPAPFSSLVTPILMILTGLQLVTFGLWVYKRSLTAILLLAATSFFTVYVYLYEPIILYVERGRDFVQQVESYRINQQAVLYFYAEQPDGLPIKYIANMQADTSPLFIYHDNELRAVSRHGVIVMRQRTYDQLPQPLKSQFRPITIGTLGHVKLIAIIRGSGHE